VNITESIDYLESLIEDPSVGLPEDLFLFASRITPMINVDLLIKNESSQTLLTWRDDNYWTPGWHIPGGIIRYKELIATRINAVAASELGATVEFKPEPVAINQLFHPAKKNRGHFISLLYECRLTGELDRQREYKALTGKPQPGEWLWHSGCPENILEVHKIYRKFM
jgi:colanic acid biosynthesis protein WcaH